MELIERIPLERIQFLEKMTYETFKQHTEQCKTEKDRKEYYEYFKGYCRGAIKTKGITKRIYAYSERIKEFSGGRLFSGGSIQGLKSSFRGFLVKDITTDIDVKNCHPVILEHLCKENKILCPNLSYYNQNRSDTLARLGDGAKEIILKAVNSDKINRKNTDAFVKDLDKECKKIQVEICCLEKYAHITKHKPSTKTYNYLGSAINRVLCVVENDILQVIVKNLTIKGIEIMTLMFDGCLIYGDHYKNETLLRELEKDILEQLGITLTLTYKEHSQSIECDDDLVVEDEKIEAEINNEKKYQIFKLKYETEYGLAFIQKQVSYVLHIGDNVQIFKAEQMRQLLSTEFFINPQGHICLWFDRWCHDKNRISYIDVGIYPHDVEVPKNYLNLWAGFAVEKLETEIEDVNPILNHIKIMMNHHEPSYEFFLNWLSNLFQYPSSTSIFVSISSKEGSGKSALIDLITYMVGSDKAKEISDMSHELFGSFNAELRDVVLMNMNEVERHDAGKCYERLKTQITSPKVRIHPKGQTPYEVTNLRKFISTNNNPHAIVIKEGNRRYFATESSNELIGNMEYFDIFYELIKSKSMQYSFWKFLMDRPVKKQLTARDIPETDLMREAYVLNRDPMEDFIEELQVGEKLYMDDVYTHYKQWMTSKGMEYKMNFKQFSMKFNRSIEPHIEDKGQNNKIIDSVHDRRRFIVLKA
jgi:hypothetical protein